MADYDESGSRGKRPPAPGSGVERRAWPRLKLDAEAVLRLDPLDDQIRSPILNASGNGLLLALPRPRPVGTRMRITVQLSNPRTDITVSGVVVHVAARPQVPALPVAVGIFLTEAGPEWLALCRRLASVQTPLTPQG